MFLIVTLPVFLSTAAIFGLELVKVILQLDVALILNGFAPYATLYNVFLQVISESGSGFSSAFAIVKFTDLLPV